jgi:hypothetical protein
MAATASANGAEEVKGDSQERSAPNIVFIVADKWQQRPRGLRKCRRIGEYQRE